jgi:hypothetical protein
MSEQFEFASPGWLQAACEIVERHLSRSDLKGVDYVLGEEFTGVPARLNSSGKARIGWTITIRDGVVTTAIEVPPADADNVNVADWEAVEHLGHHVFGVDTEKDAAVAREVEGLEAAGKLRRILRRPQPPKLQTAFAPIHNLVVAITAPRRDA